MRKQDLVKRISKETTIPMFDVIPILENFFTEVKKSVIKGEEVELPGFGTFLTKRNLPKTARILQTNTQIIVPSCTKPIFKPASEFKDAVRAIKEHK